LNWTFHRCTPDGTTNTAVQTADNTDCIVDKGVLLSSFRRCQHPPHHICSIILHNKLVYHHTVQSKWRLKFDKIFANTWAFWANSLCICGYYQQYWASRCWLL